MTAPIYGNAPDVVKLARLERRVRNLGFRIALPQPRWTTPTLLNGCSSVGAPFEPFGWRVGVGAGIQFRGRLSVPSSGVVAFEIPLTADPSDPGGTKLPHVRHDFEISTVVDFAGTRKFASFHFDSTTGEVTVHVVA